MLDECRIGVGVDGASRPETTGFTLHMGKVRLSEFLAFIVI